MRKEIIVSTKTENKLVFGTKAETLERIRDLLSCSTVPEIYYFTSEKWLNEPDKILNRITEIFRNKKIVVRSSAIAEDSEISAMAGMYHSELGVCTQNSDQLKAAIDRVVESYRKSQHTQNDKDQVLIQPMVENVSMSGVIFTHDLNTGAPYYVINYDDITGKTDTVTSGNTDTSRTLLIHRKHVNAIQSKRFEALLKAVQEIESYSPSLGLDIEFAENKDKEIFIFQVRRLAVQKNWDRGITQQIDASLKEIQKFVQYRFQSNYGVLGNSSLFGEMPDWNPAELIGAVPRALSRSFYEMLITNSVWAEARADMGYRDLSNRPLMVNFGGRVYIDVRESFNSFLPAKLPSAIGEKLVSEWLDYLKEHPEKHDKIEFEIAITAYTFDFETMASKVCNNLDSDVLDQFRTSLKKITNEIVCQEKVDIQEQLDKIELLDQRRQTILCQKSKAHPIVLASELLKDCAALGTLPFSILARSAFIAESFLKSIENLENFDSEIVSVFRKSVNTVLTEFLEGIHDFDDVDERTKFIKRFGHLRPGTYDILALRYDQRAEFESVFLKEKQKSREITSFHINEKQNIELNQKLSEHGLVFEVSTLFDFMKKSIEGREYAKLVFTRNVSDALELIADWGNEVGLSREELSFLTIEQIQKSINNTFHKPKEDYFRQICKHEREANEISQALKLPYLISKVSDVYIVPLLKSRANFITKLRVQAPIFYLSGQELGSLNMANRIVLIERADPGYDWIFMSPIAGLITQYGGANSHMAIRCAELNIPAAIGCGEQLFEQLKGAQNALLDCGAGLFVPTN
jgi:glutamine kinase